MQGTMCLQVYFTDIYIYIYSIEHAGNNVLAGFNFSAFAAESKHYFHYILQEPGFPNECE